MPLSFLLAEFVPAQTGFSLSSACSMNHLAGFGRRGHNNQARGESARKD
jgi:hypothetical protein